MMEVPFKPLEGVVSLRFWAEMADPASNFFFAHARWRSPHFVREGDFTAEGEASISQP